MTLDAAYAGGDVEQVVVAALGVERLEVERCRDGDEARARQRDVELLRAVKLRARPRVTSIFRAVHEIEARIVRTNAKRIVRARLTTLPSPGTMRKSMSPLRPVSLSTAVSWREMVVPTGVSCRPTNSASQYRKWRTGRTENDSWARRTEA